MFRHPLYDQIAVVWGAKADEFRKHGLDWQSKMLEWCLEDLESRVTAWLNEPITVRTCARETGRSESAIRRDVRDEKLENVAKPGEFIHIRRGTIARCKGILTLEEDNTMKKERHRKS